MSGFCCWMPTSGLRRNWRRKSGLFDVGRSIAAITSTACSSSRPIPAAWQLSELEPTPACCSAGRYERLGTEEPLAAGDVEVHEHILLDGAAGYLQAPMLHEDFKDLQQFIDRHNRYSTWDARMRELLANGSGQVDSIQPRLFGAPVERKRFLKKLWLRLPAKPLLRFLYMYVFRAGFLDGRAGFVYACFKAIQEFHIGAKQYEKRLSRGEPATGATARPAVATR